MKPTLLYITDLLAPYRVDWMNELANDFEITCFHFNKTDETREKAWLEGRKVHFNSVLMSEKKLFLFRYSSECLKKVKKSNYDFYLVDGYNSLIQYKLIKLLTKRRLKVYVNIDGIDVWKRQTLFQKLKNLLKKNIYSSGAKFLCGSQIAAEYIIKNGAKSNDVFVHPFTSLFNRDICTIEEKNNNKKLYKEHFGLSKYKIVTAVGRFIGLKRYEDLLKAWKGVSEDAFLFLIGGGQLKQNYLDIIKDLELKNVRVLDFVDKEELNKIYYISDLFVHTSESETWGLVINEAMAKGCPCIATKHCVAGVELIKNNINGYLIDVGDTDSLHSRINDILADNKKSNQMSKNALATISKYTIENLAKTHRDIFLSNK